MITLAEGNANGDLKGLSYYPCVLVHKQSQCPLWLQKHLVWSQGHGLLPAWAGLLSSLNDQARRAEADKQEQDCGLETPDRGRQAQVGRQFTLVGNPQGPAWARSVCVWGLCGSRATLGNETSKGPLPDEIQDTGVNSDFR